MTYNTGNPIGSTDARDRLDNSENMDILENSTTLNAHADRLGTMRKTRKGMEFEHDNQISAHEAEHDAQIAAHEAEHDNQMQSFENDFDSRLVGMAFTRVGTFTAGATLTDMRQTLLWEVSQGGDGHEYGWTGSFGTSGKAVAAGSSPSPIAAGSWVDRTDLTLRSDLNIVVKVFEVVADMIADASLVIGQKCRTLGYYDVGDGGANNYEIVAAATGTDDGGSYIDLSGSGYQAKGLFVDGAVNAKQFGAKGDVDSYVNLQNASSYSSQNGLTVSVSNTLCNESVLINSMITGTGRTRPFEFNISKNEDNSNDVLVTSYTLNMENIGICNTSPVRGGSGIYINGNSKWFNAKNIKISGFDCGIKYSGSYSNIYDFNANGNNYGLFITSAEDWTGSLHIVGGHVRGNYECGIGIDFTSTQTGHLTDVCVSDVTLEDNKYHIKSTQTNIQNTTPVGISIFRNLYMGDGCNSCIYWDNGIGVVDGMGSNSISGGGSPEYMQVGFNPKKDPSYGVQFYGGRLTLKNTAINSSIFNNIGETKTVAFGSGRDLGASVLIDGSTNGEIIFENVTSNCFVPVQCTNGGVISTKSTKIKNYISNGMFYRDPISNNDITLSAMTASLLAEKNSYGNYGIKVVPTGAFSTVGFNYSIPNELIGKTMYLGIIMGGTTGTINDTFPYESSIGNTEFEIDTLAQKLTSATMFDGGGGNYSFRPIGYSKIYQDVSWLPVKVKQNSGTVLFRSGVNGSSPEINIFGVFLTTYDNFSKIGVFTEL